MEHFVHIHLLLNPDDASSYAHNHSLEQVDMAKLNSAVKRVAMIKMGKGYKTSKVKRNLKSQIRPEHASEFEKAGDKYLSLAHLHNAGKLFRLLNKNRRMDGRRNPWEEQRSDAQK